MTARSIHPAWAPREGSCAWVYLVPIALVVLTMPFWALLFLPAALAGGVVTGQVTIVVATLARASRRS